MGTKSTSKYTRYTPIIQELIKDIQKVLEIDFPTLYEDIKFYAMSTPIEKNSSSNYTAEEVLKKITYQRIHDRLNNDLKHMKSVINLELYDFSDAEIQDLLKFLFYYRYKYQGEFYQNGSDSENATKSLHSHFKDGKFSYRYEKLYLDMTALANTYVYKNSPITVNTDEITALVDFKRNYMTELENDIIRLHKYQKLHCWYDVILQAIEHIKHIETHRECLMYAYHYYIIILDSIRLMMLSVFKNNYSNLFDFMTFKEIIKSALLNQNKLSSPKCVHDSIQEYLLQLQLCAFQKERSIWINAIDYLITETKNSSNYADYTTKYSVNDKKETNLSNKELMNLFCEDNPIRLDYFSEKLDDCRYIFQWYKQYRKIPLCENELLVLKAIYRECFIYNSIPQKISRKKIKSFINSIRNENGASDIMSETEIFILEKIERGISREKDRLKLYISEKELAKKYYSFEMELLSYNMHGAYLSNTANVLATSSYEIIMYVLMEEAN